MRRRIAWLVAGTTSAVILAFVIPLCLLVRTMAEDRAMAHADEEARNVAILVSGLRADPRLPELVDAVDARSPALTTVLLADGRRLGSTPLEDTDVRTDPEVARARRGKAFTLREGGGAEILVPVVTGTGTDVVHTTVTAADLHQGVRRAWLSIGALGLVLLVVSVLVADRFGRRISTPVTAVARVAHRLQEGELDARAEPAGPPETVELGRALNRLAERVVELLAAERAAVGDLSHRLRTPVTALRLDAEAVRQPEVAERLAEHVAALERTVDAIVKDARRPVRATMGARCDATAVVRERTAFWSALAEDQERAVTLVLPAGPLLVPLSAEDLRDVVDVLVDNVFAHTPEGTGFTIELVSGEQTRLVVTDAGPGPSYPVEPRQGSTGLGLQIVRRTVAAAGGTVTVTHGDRGTRVEVRVPPAQSSWPSSS